MLFCRTDLLVTAIVSETLAVLYNGSFAISCCHNGETFNNGQTDKLKLIIPSLRPEAAKGFIPSTFVLLLFSAINTL
jgi:hypothetical protein